MSDSNNSGPAPEVDSAAVLFIKELFGSTTEHPVFLCSLPNTQGDPNEPSPRQILTRDGDKAAAFVKRWDRRGRGLFFCVGTVAKGQPRNKTTILETIGLQVDIDFKMVDADEPDIREKLRLLRLPPSALVRSGHGLHVYWLFKEGLESQLYQDRIEAALKQLADIVAGDLAVAEMSRLMRLPGSHNTKDGEWREVVCEFTDGPRYEFDDIEEWLSETAPVLRRKGVTPLPGEVGSNPFLEAAKLQGFKPSVDVEQLLADMAFGNIHSSQLSISASLLNAGQDVDEVVNLLLHATRAAAGDIGSRWNWRLEQRNLERMCLTWIKKRDQSTTRQPRERLSATSATSPEMRQNASENREQVVNLGAERAVRAQLKPKSIPKAGSAAFTVIEGLILKLRQVSYDIMLADGEIWLYQDGFWRLMTPTDEQWLKTEVQEGFETLGESARTAALTSAWKRLCEHPRLYKADVPWAEAGMVVCPNGVVRIGETLTFEGHSPENYARRHIGAPFIPGTLCPMFEELLMSMFSNRADADDVIATIQEWLGAALATSFLTREERRALILVGPSRTGKTELARIFARLLGGPIATPSVSDLSEKFGMESLYGAAAWIRDDAINEGDKLDPQRFKTVVTGESIDINLKNRPAARAVSLNIPVCLTCNTLPRARDGSDAIFNRSMIVDMTNVVDEATAAASRLVQSQSIGISIFEAEGSGILNWALHGLGRLRARGRYEIPESMMLAIQHFKDDNNPVAAWSREAIEIDPYSRVERRDLVRSYNAWELELEGDEARAHGGRWLLPRLRSQVRGLGDMQTHTGARYITGLRLTDVGLNLWAAYERANPRGGAGGFATSKETVNQVHS